MNVHELIDQFALLIDPMGRDFQRIDNAPWIDALEARLPSRFPASFRSLVTRYAFPSFTSGGLYFFGNQDVDSLEELRVAILNDPHIASVTLKSGFLQFARPEGGSYDPICFDARHSVSNREFAIVRLDHEDILCRERIREVAVVSDSFYRFVADLVSQAKRDVD